jgi:hypothetical protein
VDKHRQEEILTRLRELRSQGLERWTQRPGWVVPVLIAVGVHLAIGLLPQPKVPRLAAAANTGDDTGQLVDVTQQLLSQDLASRQAGASDLKLPADTLPPPPPGGAADLAAQVEPLPEPVRDVLPEKVLAEAVTAANQAPETSTASQLTSETAMATTIQLPPPRRITPERRRSESPLPAEPSVPAAGAAALAPTPPPPTPPTAPLQAPPPGTTPSASTPSSDGDTSIGATIAKVDTTSPTPRPADGPSPLARLWAEARPVSGPSLENMPENAEVRQSSLDALSSAGPDVQDGASLPLDGATVQVRVQGPSVYLLRVPGP